jgi:hypothetical protein
MLSRVVARLARRHCQAALATSRRAAATSGAERVRLKIISRELTACHGDSPHGLRDVEGPAAHR